MVKRAGETDAQYQARLKREKAKQQTEAPLQTGQPTNTVAPNQSIPDVSKISKEDRPTDKFGKPLTDKELSANLKEQFPDQRTGELTPEQKAATQTPRSKFFEGTSGVPLTVEEGEQLKKFANATPQQLETFKEQGVISQDVIDRLSPRALGREDEKALVTERASEFGLDKPFQFEETEIDAKAIRQELRAEMKKNNLFIELDARNKGDVEFSRGALKRLENSFADQGLTMEEANAQLVKMSQDELNALHDQEISNLDFVRGRIGWLPFGLGKFESEIGGSPEARVQELTSRLEPKKQQSLNTVRLMQEGTITPEQALSKLNALEGQVDNDLILIKTEAAISPSVVANGDVAGYQADELEFRDDLFFARQQAANFIRTGDVDTFALEQRLSEANKNNGE